MAKSRPAPAASTRPRLARAAKSAAVKAVHATFNENTSGIEKTAAVTAPKKNKAAGRKTKAAPKKRHISPASKGSVAATANDRAAIETAVAYHDEVVKESGRVKKDAKGKKAAAPKKTKAAPKKKAASAAPPKKKTTAATAERPAGVEKSVPAPEDPLRSLLMRCGNGFAIMGSEGRTIGNVPGYASNRGSPA